MPQTAQPQLQTCTIQLVSHAPRVYYLSRFLSDAECDEMIALSIPKMARSTTVDPDSGKDIIVESRSSQTCFHQRQESPLTTLIENRISQLIHHPVDNAEGFQVIHYGIGQEYRPHFDFFDPNLKGSAHAVARGGQRLATIIMYLSTPEAGGETILPEVQLSFRAVKGDAVLFYNLLPNGDVDRLTLHGSTPVQAGEKWACTKWLRETPY